MKYPLIAISDFFTWLLTLFQGEQLSTTLSVIAAFATLWVAIVTKKIATKAYNQIEREDPWKLTPIKNELWMLERVHPSIATIEGQAILPNGIAHNLQQYISLLKKEPLGVEFYNPKKEPPTYFLRGSKVIIKIPTSVPVGSSLSLYYTEHATIAKAEEFSDYRGIIDESIVKSIIEIKRTRFHLIVRLFRSKKTTKVWETPVYSVDAYL